MRGNIAAWTGECGNREEALRLFKALFHDEARVLGPDHPDTLKTRHNIAIWTGMCGDHRKVLQLWRKLLPDYERVLGPDHPETVTMRDAIVQLKSISKRRRN